MRMAEPTRQCLLPTALVAVIVLGGATVMLHTQSELSRQSAEDANRKHAELSQELATARAALREHQAILMESRGDGGLLRREIESKTFACKREKAELKTQVSILESKLAIAQAAARKAESLSAAAQSCRLPFLKGVAGGKSADGFVPKTRFEMVEWESFDERHVFSNVRIKGRIARMGATREELNAVVTKGKEMLGLGEDFKLALGYRRHDPSPTGPGTEYILDFGTSTCRPGNCPRYYEIGGPFQRATLSRPPGPELIPECLGGDGATSSANAGQRALSKAECEPGTEEHCGDLHLIMPLSGRVDVFESFLSMLAREILVAVPSKVSDARATMPIERPPGIRLIVVYFKDKSGNEGAVLVKGLLARFRKSHGLKFDFLLQPDGTSFSRGTGLSVGAHAAARTGQNPSNERNPLLFFVDVDMWFDAGFIFRCMNNPVPGARVYYPIVYSLYQNWDRESKKFAEEMQNAGLWRDDGFGMVCLYRDDFNKFGGFDTSITGWGMEDVKMFDKMVGSKQIDVFRGIDKGIMHVWHDKDCGGVVDTDQHIMCIGTKATLEGDKKALGTKIAEYRLRIEKLTAQLGEVVE